MSNQPTWATILGPEKKKDYFNDILKHVHEVQSTGKTVYPSDQDRFNAFKLTSFESTQVVILGQDPYHGPNQAHGLCFSVQPGTPHPPSLRNIFLEREQDLGISKQSHGCLSTWAEQGVLLLNTVLSVEAGEAHSHANIGWETFTDFVIQEISQHKSDVVFLLWGSHAQKKATLINEDKHHILKAPHPSPLSAHRGFIGCQHFSKTNAILIENGIAPIDWRNDLSASQEQPEKMALSETN